MEPNIESVEIIEGQKIKVLIKNITKTTTRDRLVITRRNEVPAPDEYSAELGRIVIKSQVYLSW